MPCKPDEPSSDAQNLHWKPDAVHAPVILESSVGRQKLEVRAGKPRATYPGTRSTGDVSQTM